MILESNSQVKTDNVYFRVTQVCSVYGEGYMQVRGNLSDKGFDDMRKRNKQHYVSIDICREIWM